VTTAGRSSGIGFVPAEGAGQAARRIDLEELTRQVERAAAGRPHGEAIAAPTRRPGSVPGVVNPRGPRHLASSAGSAGARKIRSRGAPTTTVTSRAQPPARALMTRLSHPTALSGSLAPVARRIAAAHQAATPATGFRAAPSAARNEHPRRRQVMNVPACPPHGFARQAELCTLPEGTPSLR
jgi:hypothetical protein